MKNARAKRTIKRRSTDEVEWNQAIKVMWALGLYEDGEHWTTSRAKLLKLGRLEPTEREGFYRLTVPLPPSRAPSTRKPRDK
jgi:hypothetical protein